MAVFHRFLSALRAVPSALRAVPLTCVIALAGLFAYPYPTLMQDVMPFVPESASGHLLRVFYANFLHSSLTHLIYDGLAILLAGFIVESVFGTRRFALLVLGIVTAVTLVDAYVYYPIIPIGLSGVQKGFIGAIVTGSFVFGYPMLGGAIIVYECWKNAGEYFGFASIGVVNDLLLDTEVAVFCHIAGFVSGMFFSYCIFRASPQLRRPPWEASP